MGRSPRVGEGDGEGSIKGTPHEEDDCSAASAHTGHPCSRVDGGSGSPRRCGKGNENAIATFGEPDGRSDLARERSDDRTTQRGPSPSGSFTVNWLTAGVISDQMTLTLTTGDGLLRTTLTVHFTNGQQPDRSDLQTFKKAS